MLIPRLFDFDPDELPGYSAERVERLLRDHPAAYLAHLDAARQVEDGMLRIGPPPDARSIDYGAGYVAALGDVIGRLRSGEFAAGTGDQRHPHGDRREH